MLSRARVSHEKASITARAELRPWVCCMLARMGSSFSSGRLGSSVARQPAPQSRVTSSVGSVGKSKNTVCLLIENDEQMAIACVGMADVNIQITLGISGEVWYLIAYLKLNVGDIKDEDGKFRPQLQTTQLQHPGLAPCSTIQELTE